MKKYLIILMASVLLLMTNCKKNETNGGNSGGNTPGGDTPGDEPQTEVQAPVIVFKELARVNGINGFYTLFVKAKNPNKVALDYEFDVDFLHNGTVVGSGEGIYCFALYPGETYMHWYNFDIPDDTDDVIIKNIRYSQSSFEAVKLNIVKEEQYNNGDLHFVFSTDEAFTDAYVYVVYYADNKIVGHSWKNFYAGDELECVFEAYTNYDRYELYINSYIYPAND